jgi:alpha-mannosidase
MNVLENDRLRVELDPATGGPCSLVDKQTGVDVLGRSSPEPAPHAVVLVDDADTWGHDRSSWDEQVGSFHLEGIQLVEHGPVRRVVRVTSRFRASRLVEDYALALGAAHVDVRVTLDWRELGRMLKLRYPTALAAAVVTAEAPYGTVTRPADGTEESMQRWVDVSGFVARAAAGLTVANDTKYAYDVRADALGADLGLTVARAVPYAHHAPAQLDAPEHHRWLDLGEQRFRLRLMPHAGDWRTAEVPRRASELNSPARCVMDTFRVAPWSGRRSFGSVGGVGVLGTAMKRAEAGDATIVRLFEANGEASEVFVELASRSEPWSLSLAAGEVATLRVPDDGSAPTRVDLCEWAGGARPPGQPAVVMRPASSRPPAPTG